MGKEMTVAAWEALGEQLYGPDKMKWKFKCPSCGHIQTPEDYKNAGANEGAIAFSCVGRWLPESKGELFDKNGGPCNYAGGGLFRLNPVSVDGHQIFDFADEPKP